MKEITEKSNEFISSSSLTKTWDDSVARTKVKHGRRIFIVAEKS